MDFFGQIAAWLEWEVSYYMAAVDTPEHGKLLLKDDARKIIDGSLFHKLAHEIKAGRLKRTSIFSAGLTPRVPAPAPKVGTGEKARKKIEGMGGKMQEMANEYEVPASMRKEQ